jgi:hypothetical protein
MVFFWTIRVTTVHVTLYFNYYFTLQGKKLIILHYHYYGNIGIVQFKGKWHSSNNQQTLHHGGDIANTADWPRQISHPHPWEPLRQGLNEGGVAGFYSIMPTGQKKIN